MKKIRVRFSAIPAGPLSAASARIALFNWLFARKEGGDFVLRFEDISLPAAPENGEENLLGDLRWLKLEWTEGPDIGGAFGPYKQSLRLKLYQRYAKILVRNGAAYPCYCLPEELEGRRGAGRRWRRRPAYDNLCRGLTAGKRAQLEKEGRKPSLRFQVKPKRIAVRDLIRGPVAFDTSLLSDFVIMRPDGAPTAEFANVLDDALMEITHVIRGEEHLCATPRENLLVEALGFSAPQYAHVSLILGPDHQPLREDDVSFSLRTFREKGYLPDAVANYLLLLGWGPPPGKEILERREMIELFSLSDLVAAPSAFDEKKAHWVGAQHIRRLGPERLADLAMPFLRSAGVLPAAVSEKSYARMVKLALVFRDYLSCLSEIAAFAPIFSGRPLVPADRAAARAPASAQVAPYLASLGKEIAKTKHTPGEFWKNALGRLRELPPRKSRGLFLGLRAALTGRTTGPDLEDLLPLIPFSLVKRRLDISQKSEGRSKK